MPDARVPTRRPSLRGPRHGARRPRRDPPPRRPPAAAARREGRLVNVLIWHVHGSWMTAFVQGPHRYIVPVDDHRGPDGRGRARTWDWPASTVERTPEQLEDEPIDVVVLQRP